MVYGLRLTRGSSRDMKTYGIKHIIVNVNYLLRVICRKPMFLLRLIRNYILLVIRPSRPPLRFIDVAVSYKCNMKCTHCSATEMLRKGCKDMTLEEYRIAADKLIKAGVLVVNITGGEPLLRQDLYEIIKAFKPDRTMIAVQTNALLLDEKRLGALKAVGVDSIGISLDGASSDIHDSFRKTTGAFDHGIKMIEIAKKMGFNVGISYCLTHHNINTKDNLQIIDLSKKYGTMLNYNLAVPIGFWKGNYDGMITKEDRILLDRMREEYPFSKTDFETNYFQKGCGAIKEKLYINAYGEVMPCPFIQITFGNILRDDVDILRDRAFQYGYFRNYARCCLAAEDMEFIKNLKCYDKNADQHQLPILHDQAFHDIKKAMADHY